MADISTIKLPDGTTYNLKDTTARSMANSAVPNTRTVNGKALSSDISLGAGNVGAYTKSETDTKINAAVASAYKYKGGVTADKLPTSGQVVGDVYNITNDSSYGKAGMNVAWNGTTWDALGSNVDLSNYVTTSDSRLSNARPASDVYAWAKAAKKPSYSASEINGLGSLATKNSLSAGDVGALPTSGGTMTGDIAFAVTGATGTSNKISFSGSTDRAQIYYNVPSADQGNLVFDMLDDTNAYIQFAQNGTVHSYISPADGTYHGNISGSAGSVAWDNVSGRPSSLPANGGNSSTVNGHTVNADVPSGAKFTDTTYGAATQSSPGLMSAADKTKLDNLSSASTEGKEGVELAIPVSGWSSNTTAVNGTDYYTYSTTSITGISNPHPTIVCSSASGVLPSAEEKMAFDNIYFVTVDTSSSKITFYAPTKPNSTIVLIVKDFTAESTSSASANLTIATSDWSSSTTSINGAKYYTAKKTVSGINQAHPPVICHTASSSAALPSKAEQTAYNCIDYTTVDTSTNTITFYAMTKPSAAIALTMV